MRIVSDDTYPIRREIRRRIDRVPEAWANSGIGAKTGLPFIYGDGGPGGRWIVFEPELHFGDDIVAPNVVGWRREAMPEYPDAAYFTVVPDWVCEVLSPSTRRLDLGEKRALYAREGVCHPWFVDPDARTLEAFELRGGQWLLLATLAGDAPVSLPPFDAITFPLDALWPEVIAGTGKAGNGEGAGHTRKGRRKEP